MPYLDEIIKSHRSRAKNDKRDLEQLLERARQCPPSRGFAQALGDESGDERGKIIAEIKRRSPSKGDLRPGLDPKLLAQDYEAGGAACLSVLTDEKFFAGSAGDLRTAREACGLPVLRKDFTVSARDVCDAKIMGADAVLLIVSVLGDEELSNFVKLAQELGLDALVEAHTVEELERAHQAGATVIGINQRDLHTFKVDPERALRLLEHLDALVAKSAPPPRPTILKVAESAIGTPQDAQRLFAAGFDALLVGEIFVKSADPAAEVASFLNASRNR